MFDAPIIEDFGSLPAELIIWPLVVLFAGNISLGIIVQIFGQKDNSWIDAWWSISFLIPNLVVIIIRETKWKELYATTPRMWLITSCEAIWALRLSGYIFLRHKREDYRYKEMRESW